MILTNTDVDLEVDAKTDLSQATDLKVLYRKPSGATGSIDATPNGTIAECVLSKEDNNEAGQWEFMVSANFQNKASAGAIAKQDITKIITVE